MLYKLDGDQEHSQFFYANDSVLIFSTPIGLLRGQESSCVMEDTQ
jgi:hypothetical protein